uniref:Uncharacterized protein n=1 Tax=Sphaerodactylus townsendi TaxID=933632 RepID=A0ACB8ESL6_9SAUR
MLTFVASHKLGLTYQLWHQVDTQSPRHGGESVVEVLKAHGKGREALQDIDELSLFKPLCKFCATVKTVREIVPVLRKAIAVAQSDTLGPVFVEFPLDVLYPYHLVKREQLKAQAAKGLVGNMVNLYLCHYVANLFAGAWEPRDRSPLPVRVPRATKGQVQQCVELISRAKKPLLLLGSQVTSPPTPVEVLRAALEHMKEERQPSNRKQRATSVHRY